MQNGFDPCFHHAKRNRTQHDMQNKAVQNFPKQVQVLPLSAGNLGRSHKSTKTSQNLRVEPSKLAVLSLNSISFSLLRIKALTSVFSSQELGLELTLWVLLTNKPKEERGKLNYCLLSR